jgi:hypothetical protein
MKMSIPKPAWAAEIPDAGWERACALFGNHDNHLFWQLTYYAEHPRQRFDATFYDREPLLEVTLDGRWASEVLATRVYDAGEWRLRELLKSVTFSDGTIVPFESIWTLNFMPPHLDTNDVDLSQGEMVMGFGSETLREMIRNIYHCKSRAEEDFFIARWIAS